MDEIEIPALPAQAGGLTSPSYRRRRSRSAALAGLHRRTARTLRSRRPDKSRDAGRNARSSRMTRAVGVGVHGGQRVELTLRPAPADTGIVFRRVDLPRAGRHPGRRRSRSPTRAWRRRCRPTATRRAEGAARSSTCCRPAPASASTTCVVDITAEEVPILDGSAASLRVPAAERRHRAAGRAASASCASSKPVEVQRRRGRSAQVGAPRAVRRLQARLRDRLRPPGGQPDRPARRVRHGLGPLQARDRARPHLRLHQGRRDDALARPGARRQPGQRRRRSTTTRCSTATACATTTSSSSTRSSTRSATCMLAGHPLLGGLHAPSSRATRSTTRCCASCSPIAIGLRDRHLRRRGQRARRPGRAGARMVSIGMKLPMNDA